MPDHATSSDPAVQRQLDRLTALSPGADILGLERITALLARVDNPHRALPPVLHVAGTNGKGSTCAFLRAAIEGAGLSAHVYTSPHLVRFNERIRLAGTLISDTALAPLLEEVLDACEFGGGDLGASFFEVTTAAALLAFARTPADACIVEVGLGGRLDATNVSSDPAVCGIAQLGIDHQSFLGDTLVEIAREKAGIAKRGRPLVTLAHEPEAAQAVAAVAEAAGAPLLVAGRDWHFDAGPDYLHYRDAQGDLTVPAPLLTGRHQSANLALAIAMLRHQDRVPIPYAALQVAPLAARWPARMQQLDPGPLADLLPPDSELWLDGGHNPAAGAAVAQALRQVSGGASRHLILGMLANKDPRGLLEPLAPLLATVTAVPVPGHEHHAPADLAEIAHRLGVSATATAPDIETALGSIAARGDRAPVVLILGSLYLAGTVLAANHEIPQ